MIEIKNLCKTYSLTDGSVEALKDVSLSIPDGDVFGIIGMSGAGKSTLVRCINMLERPTAGSVVIDGKDLTKMTEKELRAERQSITMIFQGFNLLMQKNCLRNVCFPLELAGVKKAEAIKKAQSLLELVGLGDKASAYPAQLSGVSPSRGRWPPTPRCCCAMKPPVLSIPRPPMPSWSSSGRSIRNSASLSLSSPIR